MSRKITAYAAIFVFLLLVTSSSAYASLTVRFLKDDYYYVGEDAIATIKSIGGLNPHVYTVTGRLPPGCYLDQSGGSTANVKGKPTTTGTYSFTVRVQAKTLDYSSGSMGYSNVYGSTACVMTVRPARNGNANTGGGGGGGGGCNSGFTLFFLLAAALILKKSA